MAAETNYVILGTGQLGLAIMDELLARGAAGSLTLVNRSGRVGETLPAGVQLATGDMNDPAVVARLCADADVVFMCAQPPYDKWPELWPPLMQAVLEGLAQTQARLVFGDNLYMYGPSGGRPIREDMPYAATGRKGKTRAQVAEMVLAAHRAGRVLAVIGRASDFYGPRVTDSAFGDRFFDAALAGKPADLVGNLDMPHTYTFIRDFARGLVTLSAEESAYGQAWHVPSAPTLTTRAFVDLVAAAIGQPVRPRPAGRLLLTVIGLFQPMVREIKEMLYEWEEPHVVDHSRFAEVFGAQTTPHAEAIAETVAWYRARTPAS